MTYSKALYKFPVHFDRVRTESHVVELFDDVVSPHVSKRFSQHANRTVLSPPPKLQHLLAGQCMRRPRRDLDEPALDRFSRDVNVSRPERSQYDFFVSVLFSVSRPNVSARSEGQKFGLHFPVLYAGKEFVLGRAFCTVPSMCLLHL